MPNWGVSFVPGAQDDGQSQNGSRPGGPRNPVQEAIQILSLRLPRVYGATSLAPAPLLNAAGGMGQPGTQGNPTAQALAQLAGLPPGVGQPAPDPWVQGAHPPAMPSFQPMPSPRIPLPNAPTPQANDNGVDERERAPQMPTFGAPQIQQPSAPPQAAPYTPPPPRVIPGDDERFKMGPEPVQPNFNVGFGQGPFGGQENRDDPNTWMSPWERLYGRYQG